MTCIVSGILRDAADIALPERLVTFEPVRSAAPWAGGASLPDPVQVQTNADGFLSVSLIPGNYRVRAVSGRNALHFSVTVPDIATASIADVMKDFPVEIGPRVLGQVLTVRDELLGIGDVAGGAAAAAAASAVVAEQAADDAEFWAAQAAGGGGGAGSAIYPSRANFIASSVPAPITAALVLSNGLVLKYVRDENGTAATTADGGNWSPAGQVYVQHFGANLNPGTTDMTAAIQAATDWVIAQPEALYHFIRLSANGETVAVSAPVTITGNSGSDRAGGIMFCEMFVVPTPGSTWGTGRAAFECLLVTNVHFDEGFNLSGRHVLPVGILLDSAVSCSVKNADLHGCTEAHLRCDKTITGSGRSFYAYNRIRQFDFGEDGYRDPAMRTAIGMDMRIADYVAFANKVYYCGLPFNLSEGPAQILGNHAFNGLLLGDPEDPAMNAKLVECDGANIQMDGNYWDNGRVIVHLRPGGSNNYIRGNHFHKNANNTALTSLEFVSHYANADLYGIMLTDNTFSGGPDFVQFNSEDDGTFRDQEAMLWRVSGNMRSGGGLVNGLPDLQMRTGVRVLSNDIANFRVPLMQFQQFGDLNDITIQSTRAMRFNVDSGNLNNSGQREFYFGRAGSYPLRIIPDVGIDVGFGQAPSDGIVGRITYSGGEFRIVPSNGAGGLNTDRRLSFDPADGEWRFGTSGAGFFLESSFGDGRVVLSSLGALDVRVPGKLPALIGNAALDLNDAIYEGAHVWPQGTEPVNAPGVGHGYVRVIRRTADQVFQMAQTSAREVYIRQSVSGTWAGWERLQRARLTLGDSLPTSGAVALDMAALTGTAQSISVTGDLTFSTTNKLGGREVSLRLVEPGTASRALAWPAGWTWMGASPPASISNQTIMVSVRFYGTAENTGVAGWVASA